MLTCAVVCTCIHNNGTENLHYWNLLPIQYMVWVFLMVTFDHCLSLHITKQLFWSCWKNRYWENLVQEDVISSNQTLKHHVTPRKNCQMYVCTKWLVVSPQSMSRLFSYYPVTPALEVNPRVYGFLMDWWKVQHIGTDWWKHCRRIAWSSIGIYRLNGQ